MLLHVSEVLRSYAVAWRACPGERVENTEEENILNYEKKLSTMCLSENKLVAQMLGNSS